MTHVRHDKREHGTASLEALLLLPVFLVLWLGVFHMYKVQGSVLMARAQARSCAWRYSNAGCRDGAPVGCSGMSSSTASLIASDPSEHNIDGVLAALGPALGTLFEGVLGSSADVRIGKTVTKTDPVVAEDGEAGAGIYLLCNERNRTMLEITQDTACALIDRDSFLGATVGCNGDREWDNEDED